MNFTERACRGLIGVAAALAPRARRAAWREEWESEVWHHLHARSDLPSSHTDGLRLIFRCFGAFPHAVWIHAEEWHVDGIRQDVRYATRSLMKRPGFTLIVVVTLGLGIGGNTAVFSVIDSVLLRPLPIPNDDRLVYTNGRMFPSGPGASVSAPDFLDYREGTSAVFDRFAAQSSSAETVVVEIEARPVELRWRGVTADFLEALGHEPAAGRAFTREETAGSDMAVVMISHSLWGRIYGFDSSALGATLLLDGVPFTVVGVLPADLGYGADVDLWFPLAFGAPQFQTRGAHFLRPLGLLRRDVTVAQAQAALDRVSAQLEAAYPETNEGWYAVVRPLRETLVGSVRPALLILLAAVGLVLLIACANVANLQLSRAAARRGEVAVRAALGASRARLARLVMIESLMLAAASAVAGLALAYLSVETLRNLEPGNLPRLDEIRIDSTALAFTAGLALTMGFLFGLVPAVRQGGGDLESALRVASRGRVGGHRRVRRALVITEVALSFVLLVSGALLLRSFLELRAVDPGFEADNAYTLPIGFAERLYPDLEAVDAARDAIARSVAALPDVVSVGMNTVLPISGQGGDTYVYAQERPPAQIFEVDNTAQHRHVDEGYFETMGIPLVAGRAFDARDDRAAPARVIINETLANQLYANENPIGRRMVAWLGELTPLEIVGVSADVRHFGLNLPASPTFYRSVRQSGARSVNLVVRGRAETELAVSTLREAVWDADPRQPVSRITPLAGFIDDALAGDRFQALLLGVFAALALVLAAIGLYGVLAHLVAERRREIGIRMAMGARGGEVAGMVVSEGLRLTLFGLGLGAAGALAAVSALRALLFGVGSGDPLIYVVTPLFLLSVALLSSWLPARQAARMDPVKVLKEDG